MNATEQVIHMTDRPPVRIYKPDWPVVADVRFTSDPESPENAAERAYVKVRQSVAEPSRLIVYGLRERGSYKQMAGFEAEGREELTDAVRKACALIGFDPQRLFDKLPAEAL